MKIGKINQQGDITTRSGNDPSNSEAPNGESFNITTGSTTAGVGGSINLNVGAGTTNSDNGSINIKSVNTQTPAAIHFYDGDDNNYVSVSSPDSLSSNVNLILPPITGTTGQFLKSSDSSGNTAWSVIEISDVDNLQSELDLKINATDAVNIQVLKDMYSPTGFVNKDDSTFAFDVPTRTFSIQPTTTSFEVYVDGTKFTKTSVETITIPNTTGFRYLYYDNTGTLISSSSAWSLKIHAPVALLYWNSTTGQLLSFGEERHGVTMDWATHSYLHSVMGTQWRGGLGLSDYTTTGDGSLLTDVQMAIGNGMIGDEDLLITITNSASPALMTFQQTLSPILTAPVVYNPGSGWRATSFQTHPIISGSNGRASYNYIDGSGAYSLVEATEGNYFAVWVLALPNYQSPIVFTLGPREDTTLDDARNNNVVGDIVGTIAPFAELKFLYRLIYQTSNSYSNSVKARLVDVADVRNTDVVKVNSSVTVSHSDLSDLSEDDHLQYVHVSIPRMITAEHTFSPTSPSAPFLLGTNAQDQLVTGFNADLLDGLHSTDFQPIDGDLTAIAALTSTSGLLKKTAANTWTLDSTIYGTGTVTSVSAAEPLAGLTITGSPITTAGTLTFALANDLAAVEGLAGTGFAVRTAADTWNNRSVTSANTKISVTNGDGVSGNVILTINEANFTGIPESAVTGLVTDLSNKQPLDEDLTAIAALTGTAGFLKTDGSGVWSVDTNTYLTSTTGVTTVSGGTTGLTPNTATSGAITLGGTLVAVNGGTGQSSYAVGDILFASTTTALSKLADVATGNALISGGVGVAPSYGKIGLTTHVTGTLPVANGGTGQTTYTNGQLLIGNTTGNTLTKATLTAGTNISITNGAGSITINATDQFTGTVTSVAALTLGTTGTDLSSTVATGTTTPVITLNVPTASATARGVLSSADWSTFNGKQAALVSGTNIKTVGGNTLLGSGDVGTIGVAYGGTGLTSVTANNLLVGNGTSAMSLLAPSGTNSRLRWTGSAYSWTADTLANLTDVTISSPTTNQVLTWNGTAWVNQSISSSATSYSTVISSWTLVSGNLYSATVTHNLGTKNVSVTLYDTANNTIVYPDSIVLTSTNVATITVAGNTHTVNVTVMANGTTIAPSSNAITVQVNGTPLTGTYSTVNFVGTNLTGSSSGDVATVTHEATLLQRFTYQAASLESPNNADWVVNSLAPAISDPTYGSLLVRSFVTGTENGVGFYASIPTGATSITFNIKGRAATAPGSSSTVILRLYSRSIPNNAAVGSWSAATTLTTITIPTNAFYQYTSVTFTLAALGLTAGNFYEFEMTRNSGTLTSAWYMAEMNMEIS